MKTFFKKTLASIGLGVFLSACALGPNYKRPEVPKPAAWKWQDNKAATKTVVSSWWLIFADPALNSLQQTALHNNQDLKAAVANVLDARAKARMSASEFFPSLNLRPDARWQQFSQESYMGQLAGGARRTIDTYGMPLDLSYELDIWGRVRRYFESSRALALASEQEYQTVYLTLTGDVATLYFILRTLDAEQDILRRTIILRRDSVDLNRSRFNAGISSEIDVTRAEVELGNAQFDLADIVGLRAQTENALAVLLGTPPSQFLMGENSLGSTIVPPVIPSGLPSDILQRRPDVAQAEFVLRSENAQVGVAITSFFPVVRLTGTAGFESSDLANVFTWPARTWSFGPSINLPIFEGGRNIANYKASKARYEASVARYRQKILVAFKEVEDALVELRQRSDQTKAQEFSLRAADTTVELIHKRYQKGLSNYFEVIDAERSQLQAQRSLQKIIGSRLTGTVRLIKALGGGW